MKLLVMVLLSFIVHVHCGLFVRSESKENQTVGEQQRSARVHRTANYDIPKNDHPNIEKFIRDIMLKQPNSLAIQEFVELLNRYPNLKKLMQDELQLFLEYSAIISELVGDGTVSLKNIDSVISEITGAGTSSTSNKSAPRNDIDLKNLMNSLQNLDTYLPDAQPNDDRSNATAKDITQSLDNVLIKMQSQIGFVRNIFSKLCRKHHSVLSAQTNKQS